MDSLPQRTYKLFGQIDTPRDLKQVSEEDLPELCSELRDYLLHALSVNPGHLGSNLGATELTVALHYVFDTPSDLLVWDVGHQAYVHKLLTGRKDSFHTLRKWGGLAGFPIPQESEYDTFAAGHASNSISAALGMAVAIARKNEHRHVIAIIGDGSMTGGLAFEGLNNATSFPNNLLIIFNDNNMSIDKNVGGLNKYLVDLLTSKTYNNVRQDFYRGLRKLKVIHDGQRGQLQSFNNRVKSFVSRQNNFFDSFGIRYLGPVDGNDVIRLVHILRDIKELHGPRLLHLSTIKGKGYTPAEEEPTIWHAPGKFNPETGERVAGETKPEPPKFQDVFGQTLVELARLDHRIVGVTPAMPSGCSMTYLMQEMPERSYDVGIAEGHAVTFSSGLAIEGMIPFCNIYSSFMQRAYDQLIHDVALTDTHVVFCLDRAGLVGEDGATHQGAFDLAYLNTIPGMTICAPRNEIELRNMMYSAAFEWRGPIAIRYPRGRGSVIDWKQPMLSLPLGKAECLTPTNLEKVSLTILSLGTISIDAFYVAERLQKEGYQVSLWDMKFMKPLDYDSLDQILSNTDKVLTIEEGSLKGGFGSEIASYILERGYQVQLRRLGLPDEFIPHGSPTDQRQYCGLDLESIQKVALELLIQ